MKAREFMFEFDEAIKNIPREAFIKNMEKLESENKTFCEWVQIFLAWSELIDLEDCKSFHWNLEEEE
jgi:hypothetical protein